MSTVEVVIVTRNRRDTLLATLARLADLPEQPATIVVDNHSDDGTIDAVQQTHPAVLTVALPANLGAAGRNAGVALSAADYVAFSDDDSWWAPGALTAAAHIFDTHPRLGLLAAHVLVGAAERSDPVCAAMAASPLPVGDRPGPAVLGFVACGAVVRRRAFLACGGFDLHYGIGGEEDLLAIDLTVSGWQVSYCPEVVAHHHPAAGRDPAGRQRRQVRNALWTTWLRRRPRGVGVRTFQVLTGSPTAQAGLRGFAEAVSHAGRIAVSRAPVPQPTEAQLRVLDASAPTDFPP